jgi:hypothetical protein
LQVAEEEGKQMSAKAEAFQRDFPLDPAPVATEMLQGLRE